jgi:hypothetical protein
MNWRSELEGCNSHAARFEMPPGECPKAPQREDHFLMASRIFFSLRSPGRGLGRLGGRTQVDPLLPSNN